MEIRQLKDVYADVRNTKELFKLTSAKQEEVMQMMHKRNGGTRKLKDVSILLRLQILGALGSIDFEPIGVRGLYYRVVSIYGLPKLESTYKKVQAMALDMRRDGSLGYEYIIDGSRHTYSSSTYAGTSEFLESIAYSYRRDIWSDSKYMVEVTVEKDSMRDILYPVCNDYGIPLSPTSGFNSETAWYNLAERYKMLDSDTKVPVLLMLTDYDTAGLRMVESARQAFDRFGVTVLLRHIGLKELHIKRFNLLTRQDKEDSSMEACELDAMTPDQARLILREAITPFADEDMFERERQQEERERMTLLDMARS